MDLGDINSHLLALERSVSSPESVDQSPLAKTMMTFIVRGLFTRLEYPYAHFPSLNLTGDLMYDPFWEAVYRLERLGFKVHITCKYRTYNKLYTLVSARYWALHLMVLQ